MSQQQRHDYFPPDSFGRAVQDELGDDVMLLLRQTLGGRDLRIPRARWTLLDDHWLVQAVGRELAERITFLFDGECVYVPALSREDDLQSLVQAGMTNAEIAVQKGVTPRHVRRQLAALNIRNPNREKRKILTATMIALDPPPALIAAE